MVKVNLIGFKQLQTILDKAPKELVNRIGHNVQFAGEQFRELAIKDAPKDTSFLTKQITKKELSPVSCEVVSGSNYSAPMEFGTKGNFRSITGVDASPYKGQPAGGTWSQFIEAIKKWVRRKGFASITNSYTGKKRTNKKDVEMLAYVIARKIYRDGVKPHPFFFKQIPIVRRDLFRNIRAELQTLFK